MKNIWKRMLAKEDPSVYKAKDAHLLQVLTTKDFLALGVGTIVSTTIFTLPGVVAAKYAGPAVALSFLAAAVVAALVAFAYAEMASTMPFAGSAYSWINVVFGEFFGWVVGWALLAEYFIAVAFVGSGLSANFRGLIEPLGFKLPAALSNPFGSNGGVIDIIAVVVLLLIAFLISRGVSEAARVQNALVILKVLAILLFIVVGATAIKFSNYTPFIPAQPTGSALSAKLVYLYIPTKTKETDTNNNTAINKEPKIPRGIVLDGFLASAALAAIESNPM